MAEKLGQRHRDIAVAKIAVAGTSSGKKGGDAGARSEWGRVKAAAEELSRLPLMPCASKLARLLRDRDSKVREEAARALGRMGNEGGARRHAGKVLGLLSDVVPLVRAAAAEAVGRMLRNADEGAGCFGQGAVDGPFGVENVVDRLGALLEDESAEVQAKAAEALGGLGELGGAQALEVARLLSSESKKVRRAAHAAVGNWAGRGAKETRLRSCPQSPEFAHLWWPPPRGGQNPAFSPGQITGPWVPP